MNREQWSRLADTQTKYGYGDFTPRDVRSGRSGYASAIPYAKSKSRNINIEEFKKGLKEELENSITLKTLSEDKMALFFNKANTLDKEAEYTRKIREEIEKIIKGNPNWDYLQASEVNKLKGFYMTKYNIHSYMINSVSSSGGYKQFKRVVNKIVKRPTKTVAKRPTKKPTPVKKPVKPVKPVKRPVRK
jgi:hypothetical protein